MTTVTTTIEVNGCEVETEVEVDAEMVEEFISRCPGKEDLGYLAAIFISACADAGVGIDLFESALDGMLLDSLLEEVKKQVGNSPYLRAYLHAELAEWAPETFEKPRA